MTIFSYIYFFSVKFEVLRNVVRLQIKAAEDFSSDTRSTRRNLIPYMKDAKKHGPVASW